MMTDRIFGAPAPQMIRISDFEFRIFLHSLGVQITTRLIALHPRNVFRISRAARRETVNVFLQLERDGIAGIGEASANAYYGENAPDVAARLERLGGFLAGSTIESPADIEAVWRDAWPLLAPSRAAQCALDVALWDWLGKRQGVTVTELALGQKPRPVASFATIGISEAGELEEKIAELAGFPFVKVKSDQSGDLSVARRVRAAMPDARIAIDANCAWAEVDFGRVAAELQEIGAEFVEQPLPPTCDADVSRLCASLPAPVFADESCVTIDDVDRMPGVFAGFNIKLVKCGGLTPALRIARRGWELGLKTMVGCMLESSVLIAAGAVAAQLTDCADLDGAWLLGDDPARGWKFETGVLTPPDGIGLGVTGTSVLFQQPI
jgi:L-alanine-DL-glutamate epimerase-like enolase superfamily enzyme